MDIASTFDAIRNRRSVRQFSSKPVEDQLLFELLELTNSAPSGFNLQPWHFILIRDREIKQLIYHIALEQEQILNAPHIVVFTANSLAWKNSYHRILSESVQRGSLSAEAARSYRKNVNSMFSTDPFGLFGFAKKIIVPLRRLNKPSGHVVTCQQEAIEYVRSQTMLAAATFMIAASGAGLATCPIEGFDEERLKKLLAVPQYMSIPVIVATGYAVQGEDSPPSFRLPLIEKLSVDLFPNVLSKVKKKGKDKKA